MTERKLGGGLNKAHLGRVKMATIVVSIATFVSSLGIIAWARPATGNAVSTTRAGQVIASAGGSVSTQLQPGPSPLQLSGSPGSATIRPLARTHGS